jgi:hypothetical protein
MDKKKQGILLMSLGALLLISVLVINTFTSKKEHNIEVSGNVKAEDVILETALPTWNGDLSLPAEIKGKAKGTMFFEGSFPVYIKNADNEILYTSLATAQGEWMTEDYVPFEIVFTQDNKNSNSTKKTKPIYLIFEKDNPSGLEEFSGSIKFILQK